MRIREKQSAQLPGLRLLHRSCSGRLFFLLALVLKAGLFFGQQVPDTLFDYRPLNPLYQKGGGPLVLIDEGHHNFHKKEGRYRAFASVLQNDGYRVAAHQGNFSKRSLKHASVLVIANALHRDNEDRSNWKHPVQQAFTDKEVEAVTQWVRRGGALFFIADHMPFPAAGEGLARALGIGFYNGFASESASGLFPGQKKELDVFRISDGTLAPHAVTTGANAGEAIPFVASFTGQAFSIPEQATSLLSFAEGYDVLLPDTAWVFHVATTRIPAWGLSQGAVFSFGKGRVAVFGEAAMFTAQVKGPKKEPFGMNSPDAPHNGQFLLNVVHWLDGRLK